MQVMGDKETPDSHQERGISIIENSNRSSSVSLSVHEDTTGGLTDVYTTRVAEILSQAARENINTEPSQGTFIPLGALSQRSSQPEPNVNCTSPAVTEILSQAARENINTEPSQGTFIPLGALSQRSSQPEPSVNYTSPAVAERLARIPEPRMAEKRTGCLLCSLLVFCSVAALLVVILVPMGYADLDYYEMGFVRQKSTGTVDRDKVYFGGRHWIGVDYTFKKFKANAHLETFDKIEIFNSDKMQVTMSCALQYFIMPDELKMLHDAYDLDYAPVLRKSAQSSIKNIAVNFTIDEYRMDRGKVSKGLFAAVRKALTGTCCPKDCKKFTCWSGCKPYSSCTVKDKGLFVFVKYFQLQKVDITDDQKKIYLQKVVEQEKQDTEKYKQNEKIERKKTEQEKIKIENQALETSQNATAKSGLIAAQAAASAKSVVEASRNSGLQIIYSAVNVTKEQHKKSLDYNRTLRNHKNAYMYVGFTTLVGREGK